MVYMVNASTHIQTNSFMAGSHVSNGSHSGTAFINILRYLFLMSTLSNQLFDC